MDLLVNVDVNYGVAQNLRIQDALTSLRTAEFLQHVWRGILPRLENISPAASHVLQSLNQWIVENHDHDQNHENDGSICVVCMQQIQASTPLGTASKTAITCGSVHSSERDHQRVLLPCGHAFHYECISTWLGIRSTCPTCRYQFPKAWRANTLAMRTLKSQLLLQSTLQHVRPEELLNVNLGHGRVHATVTITLHHFSQETTDGSFYPCECYAVPVFVNSRSEPRNVASLEATSTFSGHLHHHEQTGVQEREQEQADVNHRPSKRRRCM